MLKPSVEQPRTPPVRIFLPAALILASIGWLGLFSVVFFTLPTVGPRWLFFFFAVLAFSGCALPGVAFLNIRFKTTPPASRTMVFRQAIWVGLYIPTLAWLQIGRVLTPAIALFLAAGFILIEALLLMKERSQRKP